MKQSFHFILTFTILSSIFTVGYAQKIDIEKSTDLVSTDGKPAFYLIEKNKMMGNADYSLQTLDKQEVAYIKLLSHQYYDQRGVLRSGIKHQVTFRTSGNTCIIDQYNAFSPQKSIAKDLVAASVIKESGLDSEAEKVFILSHNGTFFIDPNAPKEPVINVNVNTAEAVKATAPAPKTYNIYIKQGKVYSDDEVVATYTDTAEQNLRKISVYNVSDEKVAEATEDTSVADDDWSITAVSSSQKMAVRYNIERPLEKLFEYLLKKGVL